MRAVWKFWHKFLPSVSQNSLILNSTCTSIKELQWLNATFPEWGQKCRKALMQVKRIVDNFQIHLWPKIFSIPSTSVLCFHFPPYFFICCYPGIAKHRPPQMKEASKGSCVSQGHPHTWIHMPEKQTIRRCCNLIYLCPTTFWQVILWHQSQMSLNPTCFPLRTKKKPSSVTQMDTALYILRLCTDASPYSTLIWRKICYIHL